MLIPSKHSGYQSGHRICPVGGGVGEVPVGRYAPGPVGTVAVIDGVTAALGFQDVAIAAVVDVFELGITRDVRDVLADLDAAMTRTLADPTSFAAFAKSVGQPAAAIGEFTGDVDGERRVKRLKHRQRRRPHRRR